MTTNLQLKGIQFVKVDLKSHPPMHLPKVFDYDIDSAYIKQYLAFANCICQGDFIIGQAMIPDSYMQFLIKYQHNLNLRLHLPIPPRIVTATILDAHSHPTIVLAPDIFTTPENATAATLPVSITTPITA